MGIKINELILNIDFIRQKVNELKDKINEKI
jgi:hypothetical protein